MSKIDSFFFKFKNLLSSGKSANLTLRADAGKATITLAVEVEVSQNVKQNNLTRNSPSRQRQRERRAKARHAAAERVEHEAAIVEVGDSAVKEAVAASENEFEKKTAEVATSKEKYPAEESTQVAVLIEPADEIETEVFSKDELDVVFTFLSDYGEEDIVNSFPEIFPGIVVNLALRVRVERLLADHFCTVVLHPPHAQTFSWPAMGPVNTEVFREIRRIQKKGFHPSHIQ